MNDELLAGLVEISSQGWNTRAEVEEIRNGSDRFRCATTADPRKSTQVGPCLILDDERDSMPVEVFLMFQWTIFLVDISGNEMPLYAPYAPVQECPLSPAQT